MNDYTPVSVKVWGDFACFTRPEMKVERVTYDLMTPSAARGILEAIFWKPEFEWRVQRIHVLKPIRRISILRNEVKSKASERAAKAWEKKGGGFFTDEHRTQRHTLALRDVAYLIDADVHLRTQTGDAHPAKFRDQFRRRVARGQCFHHPYLGCREFAAAFAEPDGSEKIPDALAGRDEPLGRMLFDLRYGDEDGRDHPLFFQARLDNGVLHVPPELYDQP